MVWFFRPVRVGGDRFDESIVAFVRRTQGSLIGEATAERIKQKWGQRTPRKKSAKLMCVAVIWRKGFLVVLLTQ